MISANIPDQSARRNVPILFISASQPNSDYTTVNARQRALLIFVTNPGNMSL